MDIISIIQTIAAFIVAISILVAVHEYGHFYAARKLGFKVEKLSIGFGKALLKWKSRDGEVEYVIAAIPLGGYVKMLGEASGESLKNQPSQEDINDTDKMRSYEMMPIWKRAVVAFAGPLFNVIFALVMYIIIGWIGQPVTAPVAGNVAIDSPAYQAGVRSGDRIVRIEGEDVNSWQRMEELFRKYTGQHVTIGIQKKEHTEYLENQKDNVVEITKLYEVKSVELKNTLNDPMLSDTTFESFGISKGSEFVINEIVPDSPAEKSGIKKGTIVSVNGKSAVNANEFIQSIKDSAGKTATITVKTDFIDNRYIVSIPKDNPSMGIVFAEKDNSIKEIQRFGIIDGVSYGFERSYDLTIMIVQGIGKLINGAISTEYVSGPITIAQIAERSIDTGLVSFLIFLAVISLNLAIMNLLPVPVLDGGHLIFLAIEKFKGSAIEPIVLEKVQMTGMALILGLMLFAMYNDLVRVLM